MQKDAELTFKASRPAGDPNKLAEFEHALAELKAAHTLFSQLAEMDKRHNPIDREKLKIHKQFCEQVYSQAQVSQQPGSVRACCAWHHSSQGTASLPVCIAQTALYCK